MAGAPVSDMTWHSAFYNLLRLSCIIYALSRGGVPERLGLGIWVTNNALSFLALVHHHDRFVDVEVLVAVIDVVTFLSFVVLALFARRYWPLFVAGIQGVTVAVHLARLMQPGMLPFGYAFGVAICAYPITVAIIAGTRQHQRRLSRHGHDSPWSICSPWSTRKTRRNGLID